MEASDQKATQAQESEVWTWGQTESGSEQHQQVWSSMGEWGVDTWTDWVCIRTSNQKDPLLSVAFSATGLEFHKPLKAEIKFLKKKKKLACA